jgi:hypothetical protein
MKEALVGGGPAWSGSDVSALEVNALLALYASVMTELRKRNVIRSFNNPVGDLGEGIVCRVLGLTLADRSVKGYDATGPDGTRYQIKTRWQRAEGWRNFVGLRDLEEGLFDRMALLVLRAEDFEPRLLFHFPYEMVLAYAKETTRGFKRITLTRDLLLDHRVDWVIGSASATSVPTGGIGAGAGVRQVGRDRTNPIPAGIPLQKVIYQVLLSAENWALPIPVMYQRILDANLYRQRNGNTVSEQQIYTRISHYPDLFVVDRSMKPQIVRIRCERSRES